MIGEIMNKVQSHGGENFTDIINENEIEITNMKVFPNPITSDNKITVEIPENLVGGEGLFIDLNGKVISSFEIKSQVKELSTTGLSPGYYFISLTKEGKTVKRKVNVIQ